MRRMMSLRYVGVVALALCTAPRGLSASATSQQDRVVSRAATLGATDITVKAAPNGGFVLGGKLAGRQFAVAIPAKWGGDVFLYAHGYSIPSSPLTVAEDPSAASAPMALQVAYAQGLAAGHIAYDKAGMGVKTATANTLRLRDFMVRLGGRRIFVGGSSMGGNIVLSLVEQHPTAFAGGLAECGVTDGWESEFGHLFDMRLAYRYLTAGTPYALPGEQDVTRSALPTDPPADSKADRDQFRTTQTVRLAMPILALFKAAAAAPGGREARIIRQVAAIGGFEPEPASFVYPLVTVALGADDLRATFGGQVYGNRTTVYAASAFTPDEAAAFNRAAQRFDADPAAVAEARRWYKVTGRLRIPLVTIHNRIDPLVPYSQATAFTKIVARAGSGKWVVQYAVPEVREPLPLGGVDGYTHCGFSRPQVTAALSALTNWVRLDKRPAADAVQ